ncbi:hypothetical protein DFH09DRAFT_928400, partial [Mycena vulgaris]
MESELIIRSQITFTSLATPLVFVNRPAENGVYTNETPLVPNTGLFRLNSTARINAAFLEHENRLWELVGLAHFLPPCTRKDELEDRIWREIDRASMEKELHWNQQRLHVDIGQVVNWLGRILSRPGIEDILDSYPREASQKNSEGGMDDIWSSPMIQTLEGPDGTLFLDGPEGEGRYLFSIAVDGFNPFHNKQAKQVVSSTGFFAILLNFPPHLRYLFENMCLLGVGP